MDTTDTYCKEARPGTSRWARAGRALLWMLLAGSVGGCRTERESTPARTATEELLISTAADSALQRVNFPWLDGKRVFVEEKYFEGYDKAYVIGLIRQRISASGALLAKTDDKADAIVEIRTGALSMDNAETLVGLPAMTVPIPLTGPLQTPELAIYKSKTSDSIAKVALFAYVRDSGRYLQAAGPMVGRAHLHLYKVLFVTWRRTDVFELTRRGKRQTPPAEAAPGQRAPRP